MISIKAMCNKYLPYDDGLTYYAGLDHDDFNRMWRECDLGPRLCWWARAAWGETRRVELINLLQDAITAPEAEVCRELARGSLDRHLSIKAYEALRVKIWAAPGCEIYGHFFLAVTRAYACWSTQDTFYALGFHLGDILGSHSAVADLVHSKWPEWPGSEGVK